jgi:hypothetical protein
MKIPQSLQENGGLPEGTIFFTVAHTFKCPLELQVSHDYSSEIITLPVAGVPGLGPGVPLHAPRPVLLADTSNTLLSAQSAHLNVHAWYDQGLVYPDTNAVGGGDPVFDFVRWGDAEPPAYCQYEQVLENIPYLNPYWS